MFALDTPNTDLDAYWATAAQILALLSLSVVVEARALQRQWGSVPAWVQLIQSALWFLILVAAALLLPSALEASRPDRSHPAWMPELTQSVIAYSVAMLVLGPALIILFAGVAEPYYFVKGFSPRVRWRAWRRSRTSRRLLKRAEEQTRRMQRLAEMAAAARERIEGDQRESRKKIEAGLTVMRKAAMSPEDVDQMMAWVEWHIIRDFEGSVALQEGEALVARAQESMQDAPARTAKIAQLVAETDDNRRQLRETSRQIAKARAAHFRSCFTSPEPGEGGRSNV